MTQLADHGATDRRRHDRFAIRKRVGIVVEGRRYDAILRDISVGGAAVKLRKPIETGTRVTLNIEDFGVYDGVVLRRFGEDMHGVEFSINERQAVQLAARLVEVYYGAASSERKEREVERHVLLP